MLHTRSSYCTHTVYCIGFNRWCCIRPCSIIVTMITSVKSPQTFCNVFRQRCKNWINVCCYIKQYYVAYCGVLPKNCGMYYSTYIIAILSQLWYCMSPLQQYTSKLWIYRLQANYWVHMSNELPQLKLPRMPSLLSNGGMHNLEGVGKQMEVDTSRNSGWYDWQGASALII